MAPPEPGVLFSVPLNESECAFGRIMLNLETQCIGPKLLAEGCILNMHPETALMELYRETTSGELPASRTVLIPGLLTGYSLIENGLWKTLGRVEVDVQEVKFPEWLGSRSVSEGVLLQGEIGSPFPMSMDELEEIEIEPGSLAAITVGELILYQLNRKDEIKFPGLTNVEVRNLGRHDLRFSPNRDLVYELAGLDPNESYYERSKRMGFDLKRFYR